MFDFAKPEYVFSDKNGLRVRNFFEGWSIKPAPGQWLHIQRYLWEFMCNCDQERYDYVLAYLSQMICDPSNTPQIMIVWQSEETGTGKGTFFDLVKWMIGDRYAKLVHDSELLLGNWTDTLANCLFLALDEAIVSGDQKTTNHLKSIITAPTLRINRKFEKPYEVPNALRIAALTNDNWAINIQSTDRRTVVMEPRGWFENGRKQGREAWVSFRKAMQSEVPAFMHSLLEMNVTLETMPPQLKTEEHSGQVTQSFNGWDRVYFEILKAGQYVWAGEDLEDGYKSFTRTSILELAKVLGIVVPKSTRLDIAKMTDRPRRTTNKSRLKVYAIPPLKEARMHFEKSVGVCGLDWEDDDPNPKWQLVLPRKF